MPPLGASRVSSTAARPAARTRSLRRCFSDSALSLRNGQARYYCEMGPHGGSGGCGSTHLPASGKAAPASLISWVTSVFTRPSPAATRLVGMRRTPRPARWPPKLTGKSAKGNARDLPTRRHPNISRRPAHLVSGVCSGMILSVLKHVRRHPRALPLLQARVCVPLPLHAGLVCGVWRSGGLSLCCCCWLWSLSLSSGISAAGHLPWTLCLLLDQHGAATQR